MNPTNTDEHKVKEEAYACIEATLKGVLAMAQLEAENGSRSWCKAIKYINDALVDLQQLQP